MNQPEEKVWPKRGTMRFKFTPAPLHELELEYGPLMEWFWGVEMDFPEVSLTLAWGKN